MKNVSDFKIIKKIDEHFVALSKNYLGIKTIQDFLSDDSRKKSFCLIYSKLEKTLITFLKDYNRN